MTYNEQLIERAKINGKLTFNPYGMSFRWCNNNCEFCYLKDYMYKKTMPLSEFQEIADNLIKWIDDNHDIIPKDLAIGMLLIGGELFCLPTSYYNTMKDLVYRVKTTLEKYDLSLYGLCICSNLLFKENKLNEMLEFYDYCKSLNIPTDFFSSYDLWGRFNSKAQVELWYNNLLKVIKKGPIGVEILLSKQGIAKYLKNKDCYEVEYFKKLLELNDKIDFGGKLLIYENNIPNIDEVVMFYKKVIDEYGITNLIKEFEIGPNDDIEFASASSLSLDKNGIIERYCDSILNINPNKSQSKNCFECVSNNKQFNQFYDNTIGCASCKYREHCHYYNKNICLLCYNYHNNIIQPKNCYRKKIYKYVELYKSNHRVSKKD